MLQPAVMKQPVVMKPVVTNPTVIPVETKLTVIPVETNPAETELRDKRGPSNAPPKAAKVKNPDANKN